MAKRLKHLGLHHQGRRMLWVQKDGKLTSRQRLFIAFKLEKRFPLTMIRAGVGWLQLDGSLVGYQRLLIALEFGKRLP
jgi:hypothetical protein